MVCCERAKRAARCAAPTADIGAGPSSRKGRTLAALPISDQSSPARQSQAQAVNRTNCNFGTASPLWGGRNCRPPLRFCAPGMLCPPQGVTPVMGGWGKAVIGERSSPLRRPPASFGSFSTWKRNSPAGRNPAKRRAPQKEIRNLPPHPPQCAHWGTFPPRGRLKGGRRNPLRKNLYFPDTRATW